MTCHGSLRRAPRTSQERIGFGAAIDYLNGIGMKSIREHEKKITKYALERIGGIKRLKIYGLGKED